MKIFKRILRIFLIIVLGIVLFLAAAPFLFKDRIQAAVKEELNNSLNAEVYFAEVGLSFFKNFPDVAISLKDFGVVNKAPFEGDSLVHAKAFELVADFNSIIAGNEIRLNSLLLKQPKLLIQVLQDGRASYDITLPDTSQTAAISGDSAATASLQIALKRYEIEDAHIIYDDATLPMRAELKGFNHAGSGDFTTSNFDLKTMTTSQEATVIYDGIAYLNKSEIEAEVDMNIDIANELIVKLLDNNIRINALQLAVDGEMAMPGDDINLDFEFSSPQTDFGSIFSLIPGVYTADFDNIKTQGKLALEGYVRGTYNETSLPGFALDLQVTDAQIQYPDLPKPLSNIQLDLHVHEPDGTFKNMLIDVQKLHTDLGNNPIDAVVRVEGLEKMKIRGNVNAKVKLEELAQMVPMEGNQLRGLFSVKASADGVYDESKGTFPQVDAIMSLANGYLKNEEYNTELTDFRFNASLQDADQDLRQARFSVPDFHFLLNGSPMDGSLEVSDFDDPNYALKARGELDLEKIMQIYPIEGMELAGKLKIEDFETRGRMSDVEAERYTELPTQGMVEVAELRYYDPTVGPPVTVEAGRARFTPERLQISSANGKLGSSDYAISGFFDNYLAFSLLENEPISGSLNMISKRFDANEWLEEEGSEEGNSEEVGSEEVAMEVFPVPANMDMDINADFGEVLYETYSLKELKGSIKLADERLSMEGVSFNLLNSPMMMSGFYETKDISKPHYAFLMDIKNLNVTEAYENFSTLRTYAPITKNIEGNATTAFAISGELDKPMMPLMNTITSEGFFEFLAAKLQSNKLFSAIASATKIQALKDLEVKEMKGWYEIANGILEVKPFRLKNKNFGILIGGEQSLAGEMDYGIDIAFPKNTVPTQTLNSLSQLTGAGLNEDDSIRLRLAIGGTIAEPKVISVTSQTADALKDKLVDKAEQKLKDKTGVDVKVDSIGQQVKDAKNQAIDSAKVAIEQAKQAAADSAKAVLEREKQKAKDKAKEELEKELEKNLGKDAKDKLNELKDKVKFPWKKKN